MPKKSKRRANAGKAGKVRNSDTSVDSAGLTANAVSMFAQQAVPMQPVADKDDLCLLVNGNAQAFSKDAPRVQVLHILDNVSAEKEMANLAVSDGTHQVWAAVARGVEGMINGKALIENSIVQVKRCTMFSFESGECKMFLSHVKVVDRNFGSMIGNPLPFTLPPILRPAPASSYDGNTFPCSDPVNAAASISSNAVPYLDRLEFTKRVLMQAVDSVGSFAYKAEADRYLKALTLPRAHTEGFRSIFIMEWCEIVERALGAQEPFAPAELDAESINEDDLQRSTDLFARIACDDTEQRIVRALANLARAIPTKREGTLKASHINYLRRFLADANDEIAIELPPTIYVDLDASYSPAKMFEGCIEMARDLLIFREGPPRGEDVSPHDRDGHPLNKDHATAPYYSSFGGGCCDCCGKTPAEVGLPHLHKCGRCRLSWYCSPSCQAKSWTEGHHEHCKTIARFAKGDTVVLHGLKKRDDLNGSRVQVEEPLPNGRFRVLLEGGCESTITMSGGKMTMYTKKLPDQTLSVNKKNLRHQRPLK